MFTQKYFFLVFSLILFQTVFAGPFSLKPELEAIFKDGHFYSENQYSQSVLFFKKLEKGKIHFIIKIKNKGKTPDTQNSELTENFLPVEYEIIIKLKNLDKIHMEEKKTASL